MRTFQFSDAKSHKFWNIDVQGTSFTVTYGKIGTAGQTQTKSFPSAEKAQAEADKLIKEKTKKGYTETTPKAFVSEAEALEASIHANPHDVAVLSAYADFLTEQGDPRGEFMQVQIALENPALSKKEREQLAATEKALFKKHENEWLNELLHKWPLYFSPTHWHDGYDPTGGKAYLFQRGLLTHVFAHRLDLRNVRALLADPNTKFVHHLFVGDVAYEDSDAYNYEDYLGPDIPEVNDDVMAHYALLRWPQLKHIRHFGWGYPCDDEYGNDTPNRCHIGGDHVYDFVKQMPDIEELHLYAHMREHMPQLVSLAMPNLRHLALYHGWDYPLDKLAANPSLTKLTHLFCHPHAIEYGDDPYIRLNHIKAICQSPHLKSLTHLRLKLADFGDDGVREIVYSGLLKRLKLLDLRHGAITDDGAAALAACPDLKHLELLQVSSNALTSVGIEALKRTGVNVEAAHMHNGDPNNYLFEGDYE